MLNNPFSLLNKTIFVTGASSGIGKAIAEECSKLGAKLIITGRDKKRLDRVYEELQGSSHIKIQADLTIDADLDAITQTIPELDGIVHSAGIVRTLPFSFVSDEELQKVMDINFMAPVKLSQKLLKLKKLRKESSIVFISSISGVSCTYAANTMYSASKGAVNGIVKGMAVDLASKSIRVNSILPGMIETNLMKDDSITEEQIAADVLRYPLKRYGKPEEVAWAAIYLLSDASKWVTGTNLLIDGGYTLL